jgi:hypothetical protein
VGTDVSILGQDLSGGEKAMATRHEFEGAGAGKGRTTRVESCVTAASPYIQDDALSIIHLCMRMILSGQRPYLCAEEAQQVRPHVHLLLQVAVSIAA